VHAQVVDAGAGDDGGAPNEPRDAGTGHGEAGDLVDQRAQHCRRFDVECGLHRSR
jgi:hypothetical protein